MAASSSTADCLKAFGAQGETLPEIYDTLLRGDIIETLDPLELVSPLLTSKDEASWNILQLMVHKSSPREMILAANEALESLHRSIWLDESDMDADEYGLPIADQIIRLMHVYRDVIVRVPLRKRGPGPIVQGFMSELNRVISLSSHSLSGDRGRRTLGLGQELATSIMGWAKGKEELTPDELKYHNEILLVFIESMLESLAFCIETSIADWAFLEVFPELGGLQAVENKDHWKEGLSVMSNIVRSYIQIRGNDLRTLPSSPTRSTLILYAHWQFGTRQSQYDHSSQLSFFQPVILASLQTNAIIYETISFLLLSLRCRCELSPETIIPLSTTLPSLCSSHPDPSIRHYAFRVLSLLLRSAASPLRMQILKTLTSDYGNLPMRTAAVGLVKESIIAALDSKSDVFASPMFLKTFGSVLFVPDPPGLFNNSTMNSSDEGRNEMARLTECLGLYYVLVVRDRANKTGIKDKDNLANVERALLEPMKKALPRWIKNAQASKGGLPPSVMPLVSLELSLERVYEALGHPRT
ncbi:hypothetical protein E1B28_007491 [Marasmius oreades]|uniref:Uncharacterized protein n=1 Tax=Marasmius oreades TaxID=181124 RepID=A0A9P7S1Y9_9AGAR|nr:uncharacterized protein E1B28_007491 [Marasmius oreades]KAG7093852.1 hypothetical protein E1B28_007491 [Marasmius oreades]